MMMKEKKALRVQGAPGRRRKGELCTVTFFCLVQGACFGRPNELPRLGCAGRLGGRAAVLLG